MGHKQWTVDPPCAGRRFGRWQVIEGAAARGKDRYWSCRCDCGTVREVYEHSLLQGTSTSCGCTRKGRVGRNRTHGATGTPEYNAWVFMRRRCRAEDRIYYHGRGITVCERWQSFENFLADMGPKPGPRYTLERIDNAGNYEPGNVRWATPLEQGSNKRNNKLLSFGGQTMTLGQWGRHLGFPHYLIKHRLRHGWSVERALTTPHTPRRRS